MVFLFSFAGSGKDSNIDYFGHFGGFIGGILLGIFVP
jgi:membrane associated rhomboid family serine protease